MCVMRINVCPTGVFRKDAHCHISCTGHLNSHVKNLFTPKDQIVTGNSSTFRFRKYLDWWSTKQVVNLEYDIRISWLAYVTSYWYYNEMWETTVHWADYECTEILEGNHFLFTLCLFHFILFLSSSTFLPPTFLKFFLLWLPFNHSLSQDHCTLLCFFPISFNLNLFLWLTSLFS